MGREKARYRPAAEPAGGAGVAAPPKGPRPAGGGGEAAAGLKRPKAQAVPATPATA